MHLLRPVVENLPASQSLHCARVSDELPYLPAMHCVGGSQTQSLALDVNVEPLRHVRKSTSEPFCGSLHPFGLVTPVHSGPSS